MKLVLEYQVMRCFYLAHVVEGFPALQFNQISKRSGVRKSSLQCILPRLVKRGWVLENQINPYTKNEVYQDNFTGKIKFKKTYSLHIFPYLINNTKVPRKHKNFWEGVAKSLYVEVNEWAIKNHKEHSVWNNTSKIKESPKYDRPIIRSIPLSNNPDYHVRVGTDLPPKITPVQFIVDE